MTKFDFIYTGLAIAQTLFKAKRKLLPFLTNLRLSKKPFWMMYLPQQYYIKGQAIQHIQKQLQPGDIILRGFSKQFLDGSLVQNKHGYTQSGIYIGFNRVIHMTTSGITNSHLFDYCRADRIAIVRPRGDNKLAVQTAKNYLMQNIPYDYFCKTGDKALSCHQFCAMCYSSIKFKKYHYKLFGIKLPAWSGSCYLDASLLDPEKVNTIGVY